MVSRGCTGASRKGFDGGNRAGGFWTTSVVCSVQWSVRTTSNWRSTLATPLPPVCSGYCPSTAGTRIWFVMT